MHFNICFRIDNSCPDVLLKLHSENKQLNLNLTEETSFHTLTIKLCDHGSDKLHNKSPSVSGLHSVLYVSSLIMKVTSPYVVINILGGF